MKRRKPLELLWRDLSITGKFSLAFGVLIALIMFVALTGYIALTTVSNRTESAIVNSMEIQRLVLEIKSGIEQTRHLEKSFFLNLPKIGFLKSQIQFADEVSFEILEVLNHSTRLKTLILGSDVSAQLRKSEVNLNFFLSVADRFSGTFNEAVDLVAKLSSDEIGLETVLENRSQKLFTRIQQSGDLSLLTLYREMQSFEKKYLVTRKRPYMQSVFNISRNLRELIAQTKGLEANEKEEALDYLDDYLSGANEILPLDVEIHSKFNEFDLHAEAVDPIIEELINLANMEVQMARTLINNTRRLATILLIITIFMAIILSGIVAVVFNRSITRNVVCLTDAAGELSSGNLEARAEIKSSDELGLLADSFNTMAEQIKALVGDLEGQAATASSRLFQALESISEGFCLYDAKGFFVLANSKYRQMFSRIETYLRPGVHYEEVLRIAAEKGIFPEAEGRIHDWVRENMYQWHNRSKVSYEQRLDNGRWLQISKYRTQNGEIVDIYTDITTRKAGEEELRKAKETAEAATQAKSEFLANMSHEIRTPMNAILGFTEILNSKISDDQQKHYLSSISSSGKTLLQLINDILDLSKIESGQMDIQYKAVNLRAILNEVKQLFLFKVQEKTLGFEMEMDPDLPSIVIIDEVRIKQILLNLVGNAVKFTSRGYIKVSVKKVSANEDQHSLELIFSVEDTGIGVPLDQQKRIFDVFKQQEGQSPFSYGGTGLGLTITKRLVEMMGGDIKVESIPEKGSTFHVVLKNIPIAASAGAPYIYPKAMETGVQFDPATIMIIDDVESARSLLKGFLEYPGFAIIEAENGKEAVDKVVRFHPDLILMDMRMPVMDGYEAVKRIRRLSANIKGTPVIAVTASAMKEEEQMAKEAGCDGFLSKPVNRMVLYKELMRFLPYKLEESIEIEPDKEAVQMMEAFNVQLLSSEIASNLPELSKILEHKLMNKWHRANSTFIISEIKEFAQQIKELGERYQFDLLIVLGGKLSKQAEAFDMEKLPETLKGFPKLVKRISEATINKS